MEDCHPGETTYCECADGAEPLLTCSAEGDWPWCPCDGQDGPQGGNGGPGSDGQGGDGDADADSDTDAGGNGQVYDELLDYFPECAATYVNDCFDYEVKIPCTNLCWRICPPGANWDGETCHGVGNWGSLEQGLARCRQLDFRYRLPTLDEMARLLNNCYPILFSYGASNYCGAYQDSALRFVMNFGQTTTYFAWLGDLDWCTDLWDQTTQACAWSVRIHNGYWAGTQFDWFYATSDPGSAASDAICVREQ